MVEVHIPVEKFNELMERLPNPLSGSIRHNQFMTWFKQETGHQIITSFRAGKVRHVIQFDNQTDAVSFKLTWL